MKRSHVNRRTWIRARQRVITTINPHNGNRHFIVPKKPPFPAPA